MLQRTLIMLQRFLLITLTLCSLTATAQWQQTGAKVRYVNGLGIPTKDTAAGVSADSSQIVIRPQDSALYIKYKRTWVKVGGGSVSGTTNRVSKFTGATSLGNSSIVDSASAVAMTITPSGNVGIGTSSPAAKLDVNGTSAFRDFTSVFAGAGNIVSNITWLSTDNGLLNVYSGGVAKVELNSSGVSYFDGGNLGIGYTAPAAKLAVSGTTLINTNTDNGVDKLQVSGSAIATRLKVNTSGQTLNINNYYNGGGGKNIWIGGGGASSTSGAEGNLAIGDNALFAITSGFFNTGIGASSLQALTTGDRNMALGFESAPGLTTGRQNTAMGANALGNLSTGSDNTGIGSGGLANITTPSSNIGIGAQSGAYFAPGVGSNNTTSSQSIYIGNDTRSSANGNTNEMVFGHAAIGQGSNTVTLGNSSITKTFLRGTTLVNTTSDNNIDKLQVTGSISGTGMKQNYVTKTGTYTATTDDYVIDCTANTFTVNLPALVGRTGMVLIIKNSGAGTITVDPNGAAVIDGAATYSLSVQYSTIQIISDGTDWKIIAKF